MTKSLVAVAFGVVLGAMGYTLAQHVAKKDEQKPRVLLEQVLAEKLDGKQAKITLVEVTKAPGAATPSHRHPGPVVGYVLDGELEMQVEGQPLKTYRKGEVFFEKTRVLHFVSRNPSKTRSARFLAFILTARDEKQLVIPASSKRE